MTSDRNAFEQNQPGSDKESTPSSPASGATGLFATLPAEATPAPEAATETAFGHGEATSAPPATPAPAAMPQAANAGFTQLLRTLTVDTSALQPAVTATPAGPAALAAPGTPGRFASEAAPSVSAGSGGFTQLFQTLETHQPATPPSGSQVAGASQMPSGSQMPGGSQMPATMPGPLPLAAPVSPAVSQRITSFDVESLRASAAHGSVPLPAPAPANPAGHVSNSAASAGSFTQLFQTSQAPGAPATGAELPSQASAPASEHLAASGAPTAEPPAPAAISEVRVVQVAQAPVQPPTSPAVPAASPVQSPAAAAGPGAFTQMFQTLQPVSRAEPTPAFERQPQAEAATLPVARSPFAAAPAVHSAPAAPAAEATSPGTFTQLFQALDFAAVPVAGPVPARPLPTAAPPHNTPSGNLPAAYPAAGDARADLGASQVFSLPSTQNQGSARAQGHPEPVANGTPFGTPFPTPARPPETVGGGLTQLLRTLDSAAPTPSYMPPVEARTVLPPVGAPPLPQPLAGPVPAGAGMGAGWTLPTPASASPPVAAPVAGPSEFTRILHASALREGALQTGAPAASVTLPPVPAANQAASLATNLAAPAPSPAEAKPQTEAGAAGLQKYLPLLLILIIFLLVAILVTVVVLLKK